MLDLEVMAEHMCYAELEAQRVTFFTQHVHYDYSKHAQAESGLSPREDETQANPQPEREALAIENEWVLNELKREMIRVHRKFRSES